MKQHNLRYSIKGLATWPGFPNITHINVNHGRQLAIFVFDEVENNQGIFLPEITLFVL